MANARIIIKGVKWNKINILFFPYVFLVKRLPIFIMKLIVVYQVRNVRQRRCKKIKKGKYFNYKIILHIY